VINLIKASKLKYIYIHAEAKLGSIHIHAHIIQPTLCECSALFVFQEQHFINLLVPASNTPLHCSHFLLHLT